VESHIKKTVLTTFGFIPNLDLSPFQNAVKLRANLPAQSTLPAITNLAFHDLTPHKIAPTAAKSILGLGMKFIVTPQHTQIDTTTTIAPLRRDIHLKTLRW